MEIGLDPTLRELDSSLIRKINWLLKRRGALSLVLNYELKEDLGWGFHAIIYCELSLGPLSVRCGPYSPLLPGPQSTRPGFRTTIAWPGLRSVVECPTFSRDHDPTVGSQNSLCAKALA
ncbi:hypothetical protein VNO77_34397 [Canavalia gladiata]|uniref:Uncharacterized protein n=1 Tax=Canavalia gladiata TaxID=3824 RepID=A0AAN9KHG6_CANGL